ncbi:MAG TPA: hypothetical protein PLM75_12405 [bacterium]|nr:hypothetical protein [bacterium]HPP88650.1 hypothetical protein [bacterium]
MKRFFLICALIIFYILLFLTIENIFNLTKYHNDIYNRKIRFLIEKNQDADILFFGASTILNSVIPEIFDNKLTEKSLKYRSFNIAMQGATLPEIYLILKNIIRYKQNKIKYAFIGIAPDCLNKKLFSNNYFRNLADFNDFLKFRDFFTTDVFQKEFLYYFTRGIETFAIYPFANFFDIKENYKIQRGYEIPNVITVVNGKINEFHYNQLLELLNVMNNWSFDDYDKNFKALNAIVKFCKNNNITPILFDVPLSQIAVDYITKEKIDFYKLQISNFAKLHNIRYFRFSDIYSTDLNDFADGLHLKFESAQKFTEYLAATFFNTLP